MPRASNRKRVLIVEDMDNQRALLKLAMRGASFDADFAADGQAALSAHRRRRYDLIVLDGAMPDVDGFEVAERIRNEHGDTDTPLVMLTAYTDTVTEPRARRVGICDVLYKPNATVGLRDYIERFLSEQ